LCAERECYADGPLCAEIHNYDPPNYALTETPTVHRWGSAADIATLNTWMDQIKAWSVYSHLPIYYGEFGSLLDWAPSNCSWGFGPKKYPLWKSPT
jgi:hypothetical protein